MPQPEDLAQDREVFARLDDQHAHPRRGSSDVAVSLGRGGSVELEPGNYVVYCDVPGHRAAGMEGTIVVGNALSQ